jgi:hypothetical protein
MNRETRLCRGARIASLCALVVAFAIPALAAASGARMPRHLIDGSSPPAVPKALRGQRRTFVMTKLRVLRVGKLRALVSNCDPVDRLPGAELVVERIGVNGHDITFLTPASSITGCDRNPRATGKPFCGRTGWNLRNGRVSDARLTICQDRNGEPVVAFAWINPLRHAQWVVVDQPGFREVYAVGAHLPVRVTTVSGFGRKGVTFHYAQYDAQGVLLTRRTLITAIAS